MPSEALAFQIPAREWRLIRFKIQTAFCMAGLIGDEHKSGQGERSRRQYK
ncbi:hypothetical protein [Neisseria meningitidis]|nr:hypothetical protein [Neisseria meningitidis]